jgi:hypothetical protein
MKLSGLSSLILIIIKILQILHTTVEQDLAFIYKYENTN